jgi:lipoprotein-anchoring transpeptidase ErfK/SrfK
MESMRETNKRRIRKAAEKGLLLLGLLGLMIVPGSSQNLSVIQSTKRVIVVSIPDRKLAILEGSKVLKTYRVAVGAAETPSPTGKFLIINRIPHPSYYHPGTVIPPSANNPIGTRWIGLDKKGYAIHGTNEPHSIGHAASHGCIRMRNQEVEELFKMVRTGDVVEIHGQHDAQMAEVFSSGTTTVVQDSGSNQLAMGQ